LQRTLQQENGNFTSPANPVKALTTVVFRRGI
jgi:hypothetical protein